MVDLFSLCTLFVHATAGVHSATETRERSEIGVPSDVSTGKGLALFGVEIGGPEDGFNLTDPAVYESAKRVGARFVDLRPIWSILEPEPGVYDWRTLDSALAYAAAVGLPATVTVRFFDHQVPAWLADENMIDQDGAPFSGYGFNGVHRSPSYWGPKARRSYLRLVDELVRHCRSNRNILAWQFFYGYNDSFYMGMWNGKQTVYDYSPYSQDMYRSYLRREKHLSLRELNARQGMHYRRWVDVAQPKPTFGELNVSRAWHDFQDYRMWSIEQMFDDIDRTVRRLDKRPLIMYYGGSPHFAAHQLSVYDIGLRLLKKHGGILDVTCYEDPVPSEIGTGIVRSYGITPMGEAWQVPPPARDVRRVLFNAFSLGAKSYQFVGNWEKMETSAEEFDRAAEVFVELAAAEPVRARAAGLLSYRTILSQVPAKPYVNPTLALVPKLQENQYSLDWHSDMSPLDDLDRYPALLDAGSEVLEHRVIERLGRYVEKGGRLVLLRRSGHYCVETGDDGYPLLKRLGCPGPQDAGFHVWPKGGGWVLRVGEEMDWTTPEGVEALLRLMEWMRVERPVTASPGILAALSRNDRREFFLTLYRPAGEAGEVMVTVRPGLVDANGRYQVRDIYEPASDTWTWSGRELETRIRVNLETHELKVLKLSPESR